MKIMKYLFFLITTLLLIGIFSFSPAEQFLSTKVRVTVIDELGNPVEGATVAIYEEEENYRNNENEVAKGVTDEKGRVTFRDLKPVSYFLDARKDDMNNDGAGVKIAPLKEGKLNKVNTVIE